MTLATPVRTAGETALLDAFANSAGANEPARAAAMARFATLGLPGRRDEPWHYTDLRSLLKGAPARSDAGAQEDGAKLRIGAGADRLLGRKHARRRPARRRAHRFA